MAMGLILEFDGVGRDEYLAVNRALGVDMPAGTGDIPSGLTYHAAGAKPGGWVVFEVWATQESQQRFMEERLGRALQEGGVNAPPSRVEWVELTANSSLG
jgi:hypothetical protein